MDKNIRVYFLALTLLFVSSIIIYSCERETVSPFANRSAKLQILLTDNPGNYDQVNIDLVEVWVKIKDSTHFYSLATNQGVYDLLQLQNGIDTTIVNDSLPPGEVQEVRLVLGNNNTIMVDSVIHDLKVPSGQKSGLKIKLNQVLVQDSLASITLDFDAGKSVVAKGNGTYSLKPVIKVLP